MKLNATDKQTAKAWFADLQKYLIKNGEWFEKRHVVEALAAFKAGEEPEAVATKIADAEFHRRAQAKGSVTQPVKLMTVTKRVHTSRTLVEAF